MEECTALPSHQVTKVIAQGEVSDCRYRSVTCAYELLQKHSTGEGAKGKGKVGRGEGGK